MVATPLPSERFNVPPVNIKLPAIFKVEFELEFNDNEPVLPVEVTVK